MKIVRKLALALLLTSLAGCGGTITPNTPNPQGSYSTKFSLIENPISEEGKMGQRASVGLDWTNVSTTPGLAFGVDESAKYADSTAVLQAELGTRPESYRGRFHDRLSR
jgi:hypothetical protein